MPLDTPDVSREKKERKQEERPGLTSSPCQRPQPAQHPPSPSLCPSQSASSSMSTKDVASSSYALTRPSLSPFLLDPSVTTVEDKAEERRRLGPGPKGGRREERARKE